MFVSRFVAAALGVCGYLLAQTAESPAIRVDVRQVLVPVIVTDAKGHHVTGLKASDFSIQEDGVPQQIAAFSTDSAPSARALIAGSEGRAATNPPPNTAPVSAQHTFVICIDTLHSAFANSARTHKALERLFEKEKPAGSQYVVLNIGRQLQVLQTATSDPSVVVSKLRNPAVQHSLGGADAANLASELNDLRQRMYTFCRRCQCDSTRDCNAEAGNLKTGLDGQAQRWTTQSREFLAQLRSVVEELGKLQTGRTLILVSDGFSLQPTREFYSIAAAFLPKMSGSKWQLRKTSNPN